MTENVKKIFEEVMIMSGKTYNLFISHSWTYSDEYEKLVNLLNLDRYFSYKNYSVPKNNPVHNAKNIEELRQAIRTQVQSCSVVLILAGVYSTYSRWINIEMDLAQHGFYYHKRIIAIEPWGALRTSQIVKNNADRVVGWQTSSIVSAIRALGQKV